MNNRFKKLIASLLAMIMLMSMLPVTTLDGIVAQAASDVIEITSPDDGSTITGKKSLTVKWAKITGADYYLFSARNLTTDAEIASRVDTGTTRSYKISASDLPYNNRFRFWVGAFDAAGNQIAGSDTNYEVNTYTSVDGSFGKSNYTMEVGEELDVAVDVSAKNGSLVRVTINVDGSGVDRLASKSISGTSWDGNLTLDGSNYPLNTPGTYKIKLFVAYGTGSNEYDEVDQATLVVEEPCSHPTSKIEEYWEQTSGYSITYKSISDTQHRASGYMYKYCGACLSRVGSNYAVTIDEAHSFDAAGDCILCDYRVSCQHPNTKPVVDTSYHNKGAEGHLVVQYGNLVCTNANCGKEVEPYYAEEMKAHTFSGDTCSLCGYTEYSEMKVVVARDQTSAETGNEISAKATVQGGSGVFSYAWEVLCDGVVVHRTDYSMSSEYSYTADKAGKWSFRVYVMDDNTEEEIIETSSDITVSEAACPHTNSTPVSQETEYIKLSDTAHEIRTFYINFCDSCGEATSGTYYQSENVAHAPDSSGHCVCGYVVPTETCQHTESLPQQIDQWINPYDETWHSVVTVYKDVCANTDCGVVLNAHREVDDKIAHLYDDAGKCVCGYVRPTDACDHAAADTLTDTSYTDLNESNHSVIRTYHYQCECGQVDYNDTKTTTEPHVFENGTCVCGRTEAVAITYGGNFSQGSYTMTVGEKLNVDVTASTTNANLSRVTINVDSSGNDRLAYADINGGTNWNGTLTLDGANAPLNVPGTYTIKLFVKVNNDDNAWAEVDQATLTVAEAAGCPHSTVEEYWEMTEGYSVTYKSVSDTHHTASGHMYKFCTLCLSRVGDNYPVTIDEAHSFDAAGDCILCDYRVSCQHKETKPKVETSGYTSKGEEGHLFFRYGNLVCANANCGKEVEPYYAEEMQDHTFSDNTCSLCGYSKAEELSVVVARGQSSAETGDIISATATAKGGSGSYKYAWEVICEGVVVDSTDYSMPSSYSYVANDIGSWTFKVYVKDASTGDVVTATTSAITVDMAACPHDLINSIQQGEPQYIKISDTTHEIRTYYNDTCGVCGDVTRADYYKSETAAHAPDANGKCVCGYTAPTATCDHANSIPQQIGQPTVEKYDEKWHEVIYIYKDVCANEACQTVLNEHREVREMVVHTFDANGKCACGYVLPTVDCDHVATKTELNPKYIAVDASCHHFTVTYHYECECGQVNYDEDAQSFDPHVYEGRTCKLCGFENPCDHADFQKVISSVVEDDKNSNSTHFVVTTYTKICECGAVNPTPIVRTTVPCGFAKSAGVQAKHESQGHQYFDRCECGNAVVNGKFKNYLSSCATCQQQYGDDALAKGTYNSSRVEELQKLLGFTGNAVDGDFGGNTESAVIEFQKKHGLPATGIVDDATWAKLVAENKQNEQETPSEQEETVKPSVSLDDKQEVMDYSIDFIERSATGKDSIYDQFFTDELRKEIKTLSEGLAATSYELIDGDPTAVLPTAQANYYVDTLMKQSANVNSDSKTISISPADFEMICNVLGWEDAWVDQINVMVEQWSTDRWTNKYGVMILDEDEWKEEMDKYQLKNPEWLSGLEDGIDYVSFLWECLYDYHIYSTALEGESAPMINSALNHMQNSDLFAAELAGGFIEDCETVEGRIAYIVARNVNLDDRLREVVTDSVLSNPTLKFAFDSSTLFNDVMFGTTDLLEANHGTYWSMQMVEELHDELDDCIERYYNNPSEANYNDCLGTYSLYTTYLISAYNGVLESIEIYSGSLAANMIGDGLTADEKALVEQWKLFMEWYADDIEYALKDNSIDAIIKQLEEMN